MAILFRKHYYGRIGFHQRGRIRVCPQAGYVGAAGAVPVLGRRFLAVEYKGADRWSAAADDRLIGSLWANLSQGRCRFVMVKDKQWEWIERVLAWGRDRMARGHCNLT